jgi:hypothetical protein
MKKLKVRIRPKQKSEQRRDVIDVAATDEPEERHDRDGILSGDDSDNETQPTLSQLLDQRRADAEEKKTQEQRSDYLEKLEAYLRRPITAAELERPELGKLFSRRNS